MRILINWTFIFSTLFIAQVFAESDKSIPNTISVEGYAEMRIPADSAELSITLITLHDTAEKAEQKGYDSGVKLNAIFSEFGITEEMINSSKISFNKDEYRENKQSKIRYRFYMNYTLSFDQFDLIDTLRERCVSAGATKFEVSDLISGNISKYEAETKKRAYQNAKASAEAILSGSELKLGSPISIQYRDKYFESSMDRNSSNGLSGTPESVRKPLLRQFKIFLKDTVIVKFEIE